MNKTIIAKRVVSGIVAVGTRQIVKAIVENNVTPTKRVDHLTVSLGTWALAGILSDALSTYTDARVDEVIGAFTSSKKVVSEVIAEVKNSPNENPFDVVASKVSSVGRQAEVMSSLSSEQSLALLKSKLTKDPLDLVLFEGVSIEDMAVLGVHVEDLNTPPDYDDVDHDLEFVKSMTEIKDEVAPGSAFSKKKK